jgi:subtilase family serine protease
MRFTCRHIHTSVAAAVAVSAVTLSGALSPPAASAVSLSVPRFVALGNSMPATTDKVDGTYSTSRMSVEVALEPRHAAAMDSELRAIYTRGDLQYHQWLRRGQFDTDYAPSGAERTAVSGYLHGAGLKVASSGSPFLVRAYGSSRRIDAAFRTSLRDYVGRHGTRYFANDTAAHVPATVASDVLGVIGLTNTVREESTPVRPRGVAHRARTRSATGCQTPYPSTQQLYNAVNKGISFPFGYGGGPGCNGLTPPQVNSMYGAPHLGSRAQGAGVTAALFELSAYQKSDIGTWARTFYGAHYRPPLTNVNVDGGPLHPRCPAGDSCPPQFNGYSGDIEVDADIEMTLEIAPHVRNLMVYNAPNDYTGQTTLDEYTAMADADRADSISSSWGVCENDVTSAYVQAENEVFQQMAMQGQSLFSSAGDTGAFDCIRSDGTTIANVGDPASQPWVTSVGGTSFENANPGSNPAPSYPAGTESVWNVGNLCNTSSNEGGHPGPYWCGATGAGGGGSSQWWGRPFYQSGPGVNSQFTTYGNGSTHCALAQRGTPCREVPDVSADADEYTPYAEYCTANAHTPYSACTFSSGQTPAGWFGIGGTSLSSPLWAAIIADRDGYLGGRTGNINPQVYQVLDIAPGLYFHDITGAGLATSSNGLFPMTPGYDEATGIGTPRMAWIITLPFF